MLATEGTEPQRNLLSIITVLCGLGDLCGYPSEIDRAQKKAALGSLGYFEKSSGLGVSLAILPISLANNPHADKA